MREEGPWSHRKMEALVFTRIRTESVNTEYLSFANKSDLTSLRCSHLPARPHLGVLRPTVVAPVVSAFSQSHKGPQSDRGCWEPSQKSRGESSGCLCSAVPAKNTDFISEGLSLRLMWELSVDV